MQTSPQRKPALWPLVLALQDLLIHRPKQDFYLINPNIIESQSQTTPTNTTETSDSLSRDGELGVAGITGAALVQPWCKREPVNLWQMVHWQDLFWFMLVAVCGLISSGVEFGLERVKEKNDAHVREAIPYPDGATEATT